MELSKELKNFIVGIKGAYPGMGSVNCEQNARKTLETKTGRKNYFELLKEFNANPLEVTEFCSSLYIVYDSKTDKKPSKRKKYAIVKDVKIPLYTKVMFIKKGEITQMVEVE